MHPLPQVEICSESEGVRYGENGVADRVTVESLQSPDLLSISSRWPSRWDGKFCFKRSRTVDCAVYSKQENVSRGVHGPGIIPQIRAGMLNSQPVGKFDPSVCVSRARLCIHPGSVFN